MIIDHFIIIESNECQPPLKKRISQAQVCSPLMRGSLGSPEFTTAKKNGKISWKISTTVLIKLQFWNYTVIMKLLLRSSAIPIALLLMVILLHHQPKQQDRIVHRIE